jgi:hypothetical protein
MGNKRCENIPREVPKRFVVFAGIPAKNSQRFKKILGCARKYWC